MVDKTKDPTLDLERHERDLSTIEKIVAQRRRLCGEDITEDGEYHVNNHSNTFGKKIKK